MGKSEQYLNFLFDGIEIEGCRVLDIGAGSGDISVYLTDKGAAHVTALEPEEEGSDYEGASFEKLSQRADIYSNLKAKSKLFQEYNTNDIYDIIVLHNTINHLHESHCKNLAGREESQHYYQDIVAKLRSLISDNGILLVADSGKTNPWAALPFSPWGIEWEKHQDPNIWIELFEQEGFRCESIHWTPVFRFGIVGKRLTENRIAALIRTSHFQLKFSPNM